MKIPKNINKINANSEIEIGAYPPNWFLEFEEAWLWNWDYFGLYWEIGKEENEPVVCEKKHDSGIIVPRFSCLDKFLEWYKLNDNNWWEKEIEDEEFIINYVNKWNDFLKQNNPEKAVESYKLGVLSFGEMSEPWFKLSTQQNRIGMKKEAQISLLNSILSNWVIGFPSQNAIRLFKNMKPIDELTDHPLIKYRDKLEFNFGWKKENDDYLILQKIIKEFKDRWDYRNWFILEQNYVNMMTWETSSFRERYNFDYEKWKQDFKKNTEQIYKRKYK